MIQDKKAFKDTMYGYDNINEYYSFYGDVIYISSDYYYYQNDYFIILKKNNKFAFVHINKDEEQRFADFKNRDNLISELEKLESTISYTEGFENFLGTIGWHLLNTFLENRSKNELIKLKNNPLVLWNCIMLETLIAVHKQNKTVAAPPLLHQTRQLNKDVWTSLVTAAHAYNTQFTLSFDWVSGNPFMDIEIFHFNHKMKRRLYFYDIIELSQIFQIMSLSDEHKTFEALVPFSQA